MCNIIVLKAGVMPTEEQLENMVYNNWHSAGLIVRRDKGLDVKHILPKNGEIDPVEIYELLDRDKSLPRILHVRHNTAGATNLENCHPFKVFDNGKKQVWFMHNGTLHDYKSKKTVESKTITGSYVWEDDPNGPSDSVNFAEDNLTPMLLGDYGNGQGSISAPKFRRALGRLWNGSNRGILISSDHEGFYTFAAGPSWKIIKGAKDEEFLSANDDYFKSVTRGPEFTRREEARKKREEENRALSVVHNKGAVKSNIVPFSQVSPSRHSFYSLRDSVSDLLNDWNVYDRANAIGLGYLVDEELKRLVAQTPEVELIGLLSWVFTDYAQLYEDMDGMKKKHESATKRISYLTNLLKKSKIDVEEITSESESEAKEGTGDQANVG
jgi:hypothetical protein